MHILGILATPYDSTRTRAGLDAVLAASAAAGATTAVELQRDATVTDTLIAALDDAEGIVFASPTFRAGVSWPLKALIDQLPRGGNGEAAPLRGTAGATVATGASDHHFLGAEDFRSRLGHVFAMQVLAPAIYLGPDDFADRALTDDGRARCATIGGALVDLARAVQTSSAIQALRPQI